VQKRIFAPTESAESWRRLLAKPDSQWRAGYSAKSAAERWEKFAGLPPEIGDQFERCGLGHAELLAALPEYKTELPGGGAASQTDLFALVRTVKGVFACAVEAKVAEPFGKTVSEWLKDASPGKIERMTYLCGLLGLDNPPEGRLRYQLLHRTAAALIEAERFGCAGAAMIVHSFSPTNQWIEEFQALRSALGVDSDSLTPAITSAGGGLPLLLGWAKGDRA
jgi:hypothetical protein